MLSLTTNTGPVNTLAPVAVGSSTDVVVIASPIRF
jgi:hypothetical protein